MAKTSLNLDKEVLDWAIGHLLTHGDTDIFPYPLEFRFLEDMRDQIATELSAENLNTWRPMNPLSGLTAKSHLGFRLGHQMHPIDTLVLTAAVATIGPDLESARRPIADQVAYAYRFAPDNKFNMFSPTHRYKDWLSSQLGMLVFGEEDHPFVVKTDIADFYQRIYHHRLENCLTDYTNGSATARFVYRFVHELRSKESFGLPVGSNASRLLAEIILNDTDRALIDEGYRFTRYVDDYIIYIRRDQNPYGALAFLAEHLATTEGLALNPAKTRIMPIDKYRDGLEWNVADGADETSESAISALVMSIYENETDQIDEKALAELAAVDFTKALKEELDKDLWDAGRIRVLLRALRLTKTPSANEFIKTNFENLLPFTRELVLLIEELKGEGETYFDDMSDQIIDLVHGPAGRQLAITRSWLLELFVRGVLEFNTEHLRRLEHFTSTIDRRQLIQMRHLTGDINYFRQGKSRIDELNGWLQPAFIYGARCLPKDEYETWVKNIRGKMNFPLSNLFCEWVIEGRRAS